MRMLVIEDGAEYLRFAALFLPEYTLVHARSAAAALQQLAAAPVDALLIDLRFERAAAADLLGDVEQTARRLFFGSQPRALRYLQDQQGTLILAALRAAGHAQPAVFIHDFPPRRLDNLRHLYGAVHAVPTFDAAAIRAALAPRP